MIIGRTACDVKCDQLTSGESYGKTTGMKRIFGLIVSLFSAPVEGGDIPWTPGQIVDAIWIAEGGARTKYPYGIKSIAVRDREHARKICMNTVTHAFTEWREYGRFRHTCFITYLSLRYCPPEVDPVGNRNWVKNVRFWLRR